MNREEIINKIYNDLLLKKERINLFFNKSYIMELLFSKITNTTPLIKNISLIKRIQNDKNITKKTTKSSLSFKLINDELFIYSSLSHIKFISHLFDKEKVLIQSELSFFEYITTGINYLKNMVYDTFFFFCFQFNDKKINSAYKKILFPGLINYYAVSLLYCFYLSKLNKVLKKNSGIKSITYFTLGPLGFAIKEICRKFNVKSRFIQHGILYNFFIPLKFDEHVFLTPWDKKYFENFFGKIENYSYTLDKTKFSLNFNDKKEKVALWALEYIVPGGTSESELIRKISDYVAVFKKQLGWNLILRPHPNDPGDWHKVLLNKNIIIDKYIDKPLEESLKLNRSLISISFFSTSLLNALSVDCLPVAIRSKEWDYCNLDFEHFSFVVNFPDSLISLLEKSITEIQEIIFIKKENMKKLYT